MQCDSKVMLPTWNILCIYYYNTYFTQSVYFTMK